MSIGDWLNVFNFVFMKLTALNFFFCLAYETMDKFSRIQLCSETMLTRKILLRIQDLAKNLVQETINLSSPFQNNCQLCNART